MINEVVTCEGNGVKMFSVHTKIEPYYDIITEEQPDGYISFSPYT
jgi:hypothetical protein